MALVDDIEYYGRAVAAGDMSREDATQALVRESGGGLTPQGAANCIANASTVRSEYTEAYNNARAGWAECMNKLNGFDDPSEK